MKRTHFGIQLLFISFVLCFLTVLHLTDNKYYNTGLLPEKGILHLTEEAFDEGPIFLIDEWRVWDGMERSKEAYAGGRRTWIGEFSNYRRYNDAERSPYGSCTYHLQIEYAGEPEIVALYFPQLCQKYELYWDNRLLAKGEARAYEMVQVTPGYHSITLCVTGESGYYAGMYFPGAIGTQKTISRMIAIKNTIYGISALAPLVLAAFCLSLWYGSREVKRKYFALVSLCFAGSLSHHFLQLIENPFSEYRFLISDIALYGMFFFAIVLMLEAIGESRPKWKKMLCHASLLISVTELLLYLAGPVWHDAIILHGMIQNGYRVFLFLCLAGAGIMISKKEGLPRFVLYCDTALGMGLLVNLFASNLFEPIYGLWQFEWCSLLFVMFFAVYMERENRQLILENQKYQEHLEELVEERTRQLTGVLEERRAFFSDMAHDLKAPLSSIKAFMYMIRSQKIGVDNELELYLEQVDVQLKEMSQRVGSLNELNAIDRLNEQPEYVEVAAFLEELYQLHNPEAVASGVHLMIQPPAESVSIRIQKKKLLLAFENLFYNALRFTDMDGSITISAEKDEGKLRIDIRDTGCGIPAEELPHIFERFYMGEKGKSTGGSGLGLYIVQTIIKEQGGRITAESEIGAGTVFHIWL